MVIRQRAIQAEDKQERHDAILDAAERLILRSPDRTASVADVADEAGLAKGTVYLYFPSKDELLLALHERHLDDFFRAVGALLAGERVAIDDMLGLTQTHIVGRASFLPLATRCFGIMQTEVPRDVALAFKERMMKRMFVAGAGLERHFGRLAPGEGVALLRHSYALILGLWQMSSANAGEVPTGIESSAMYRWDYTTELARALRHLWEGAVAAPVAPPPLTALKGKSP